MIDIKRIGKLSGSDCLAILFSSDSETIKVRIEGKDWIEINSGEVYIFEGLEAHSCYHISAKTDTEEQITAFQTMPNMFVPPRSYIHAGGTLRRGRDG